MDGYSFVRAVPQPMRHSSVEDAKGIILRIGSPVAGLDKPGSTGRVSAVLYRSRPVSAQVKPDPKTVMLLDTGLCPGMIPGPGVPGTFDMRAVVFIPL